MSNSDNIKKDKDILISEENKNALNSNGIKEQEEYKSLLMELPEHVKYNQAEQILNYSDNNHDGYLPLLTMYLNCLDVMEKTIDNKLSTKELDEKERLIKREKFNSLIKSLKNSKECIKDLSRCGEEFKKIENTGDDSFLILPMLVEGHVFSLVTYNVGEEYEIIAINKGDRFDKKRCDIHYPFEKYIVPKKNIENIINFFTFEKNNHTTEQIYDVLRENTRFKTYEEMKNINARDQRSGNCYYKELEEGLKYVYSRLFNEYEINEYFDGEKNRTVKIPKPPIPTQQFHEKIIKNIRECCNDETKLKLDKLVDIYNKNKIFRDTIEDTRVLTLDEKKKKFLEIFGAKREEKDEVIKCLYMVDERTFQENLDVFIAILQDNEIEVPMVMYESEIMMFCTDFVESAGSYFDVTENYEDVNILKEYFPLVTKRLIKDETEKTIKEIYKKIDMADYIKDEQYEEELIERGLKITEDNIDRAMLYNKLARLREEKGYFREAEELYKKAYTECYHMDFELEKIYERKYNEIKEVIKNSELRLKDINYTNEEATKLQIADELKQMGYLKKSREFYMDVLQNAPKDQYNHYTDVIENIQELSSKILDREINSDRKDYSNIVIEKLLPREIENLKYYDMEIQLLKKGDYKNLAKLVEKKATHVEKIAIFIKKVNEVGGRNNLESEISSLYRMSLKYYKQAQMILDEYGKNAEDKEKTADILKKMGNIFKESRQYEMMENYYDEAIERYEKAEKEASKDKAISKNIKNKKDELLNEDYKNGHIYNLGGPASLMENELDELKTMLKSMFEKDVTINVIMDMVEGILFTGPEGKLDSLSCNFMIHQFMILGKNKEAVEFIDKIISKGIEEPKKINLLKKRIICLKNLEKKDEAIKECDNIISMVKNNPEKRNVYANVCFFKAKLLQELGRKKEALEAYHEILNLYPKNSEMWKRTQMNRSIQINMAELSKDYIKNQKLGNEKNILFDIKDLYSKNKQKESSKDRTINVNL